MNRINLLLTLLSLNAILIIIERLSPTTKIILQPYNFLRLHEVFQMIVIISISIVISFFLFKALTNNFESLKSKNGIILGTIFILGIYFTATGNGLHEATSYIFNTFCDTRQIANGFCASAFFNDYYFGNIMYFVGLLLSNFSLALFEKQNPGNNGNRKDFIITLVNGTAFALTLIAYAAFDRVLVGLGFVAVSMIVFDTLLFTSKKQFKLLPFTLYSAFAYTFSTILTVIIRLH